MRRTGIRAGWRGVRVCRVGAGGGGADLLHL